MSKTISIITPCYNEAAGLAECYQAVRDIFAEHLPDYQREHIFCDNASTDDSVRILKEIAADDPSVKVIVNSRNFGALRNTFNGVVNASGDAVVLFLPADLQDPPELIPQFVALWEQGYEVVFGIRDRRNDGFLFRTARKLYYNIISRFSYVDYPAEAGEFQLIDSKVLSVMKTFDDAFPFLRMMTFDCGFRSVGVPYSWAVRKHGLSRFSAYHLIDQGLAGIISFSNVPLRLAFFSGLIVAVLSVLYGLVVALLKLFFIDVAPQGIPTIIVAVFFFGGVQLVFIGLIGEYLIAIFNQVRNRPIVIERERFNFERQPDRAGEPPASARAADGTGDRGG